MEDFERNMTISLFGPPYPKDARFEFITVLSHQVDFYLSWLSKAQSFRAVIQKAFNTMGYYLNSG